MNQRYQSASAVLTALRERLTSARTSNPANILETIVTALAESRGYSWTGIYLAVAEHGVLQSASGAAPASVDVAQVNAEI
ncbi:MAG TPA: hypothetical protein VE133_04175, partial [Candidatus Sulfotelmatobacter sp.]|nr:hypothetical protein [Candidatus Sulfotelmatobacter sp.]